MAVPPPARAFAVAGAAGSLAAALAGRLAAPITRPPTRTLPEWTAGTWLSGFAIAVAAAASLGLPYLTASFALAGYEDGWGYPSQEDRAAIAQIMANIQAEHPVGTAAIAPQKA